MDWGSIISAGASLVGGWLSADAAGDAADKASGTSEAATALASQRAAKVDQAVNNFLSLVPPNLQQYVVPLTQQVVAGKITPEEFNNQLQEQTALSGIQIPPAILAAQQNALSQIQQIANEGGLTAIDKAKLNDIQSQQANRSAAEQGAIIQNAQQRGVSGSGLEMGARLISQQGTANQAAADGLTVAANAQQRALEAIKAGATQANAMNDQSYNQQAQEAKAKDAINAFNTGLTNSANSANVSGRNVAQAANLAQQQKVNDYNATLPALDAAAKAAAAQQQWTNTYNQGNAAMSTTAGLANNAMSNQLSTQQQANGLQNQANAGNAAAIQQLGTAATTISNGLKKKDNTSTGDEPYPGYNASVGL